MTNEQIFNANMTEAQAGHFDFKNEIIMTHDLSQKIDELQLKKDYFGAKLKWKNFWDDKYNRPKFSLQPNEITIISGYSNVGKSTFMNNLILQTLQESTLNWKWAIFSPEYSIEILIQDLIQIYSGKTFYGEYNTEKISISERKKIEVFLDRHLFFLNPTPKNVTIEKIFAQIKELKSIFNINAFLLDPYNEFSYNRPRHLNENDFVAWFMANIKRFCKDENVHAFIVAHPAKMPKGDRRSEAPTPNDISGSSAWDTKADNILTVFRKPRSDNPLMETEIHIQKVRNKHSGQADIVIPLYFHYKKLRLLDTPDPDLKQGTYQEKYKNGYTPTKRKDINN